MDRQNSEDSNDVRVESVRISYKGVDSEKQAISLHSEIYRRLDLKISPPERILNSKVKLGVAEVLITITLAPIFQYAFTHILKVLRDIFGDREKIPHKGQIIIKFDDSDLGRRFPFASKEINLKEFFGIIDEYIKDLQKKSLLELIERKAKIDEEIKKMFKKEATFLNIDVISSGQVLQKKADLTAFAYSLEQYHKFVKERVERNQGTVLSNIGFEMMAWFALANNAINCALAILKDRGNFNKNKNKLNHPFQFKIGINSGLALIDEKEGKVFCKGPLELAREVQKIAEPGTFSVSEYILRKLENKKFFVKNKYIESNRIWTYAPHILNIGLS